MEKIKKFFDNKKLDKKFKKAGSGHLLTESISRQSYFRDVSPDRVLPIASAQMAGSAALNRFEKKIQSVESDSQRAIRLRVKREMEQEKKRQKDEEEVQRAVDARNRKITEMDAVPSVQCIRLICPFCDSSEPKFEIDDHMFSCLQETFDENPSVVSITMFFSLNRNPEKLDAGKDILTRILKNIINNPTEEKFRKLRFSTNAYQAKVQPIKGGDQVLTAAGFERQGDAWVMPASMEDYEKLQMLLQMLDEGQPLMPKLDRQLRVFSTVSRVFAPIPNDFYLLSKEEVLREQRLKKEALERSQQLRTKKMREKDEIQEIRHYKYTLIRVSFPDNCLLQGIFNVYETLESVYKFVQSVLQTEDVIDFYLKEMTGKKLTDRKATLADLKLVPAVLLNFHWDSSVDFSDGMFLKSSIMENLESLS